MGRLHKDFERTMTQIGFVNAKMPTAVFYDAPLGIRFEIGGSESVYLPKHKGINKVYLEHAFSRAKALFDDLPCRPNLLRIDSYPEDSGSDIIPFRTECVRPHGHALSGCPQGYANTSTNWFAFTWRIRKRKPYGWGG